MSKRLESLHDWLKKDCQLHKYDLTVASADASFRQYFRVTLANKKTYIVMDAPPEKEDCRPFVQVAQYLSAMNLHAPEIIQQDLSQGFLLLEDLGDNLYANALNEQTVDRLYGDALSALMVMQTCIIADDLPHYNKALLSQELALFSDWYLAKHCQYTLTDKQRTDLDQIFKLLIDNHLAQPQVFVHRDFHSRNLLVTKSPSPAIIDFQDAVKGALTYDLMSLIKDCYVQWSDEKILEWIKGYYELANQSGLIHEISEDHFIRWAELTAVQRHLKAIGIFARLNIRDNKPNYLKDIPRTMGYILALEHQYPELKPLIDILHQTK